MQHCRFLLTLGLLTTVVLGGAGEVRAQKSYDDHHPDDRFYIRLGGFQQSEIRTTLRLDAKTPQGAVAAGTVIVLESLFDIQQEVTTTRLDGWWRFDKKNRINWTYWRSLRDGTRVYTGDESIDIGDITIQPGDTLRSDADRTIVAVFYTYSFLNTAKYEAWLGGGFNVQSLNLSFQASLDGNEFDRDESAEGTLPIPVLNFGGRWNFSPRWRALLTVDAFGLEISDYSGRLNDTRLLVEYKFVKNFGIGAGVERYSFEVDAENDDFRGELDSTYTGWTLYLKGQF
jgi:hypothetical protein